jgi:phosphatidate cytidylyltransferase
MPPSEGSAALTALLGLGALSVALLAGAVFPSRIRVPESLRVLWILFLVASVTEWFSFTAAIWILGFFAFAALREYFSLLDIRLSDRWALLAAYLCIPCVIYLIQIDWYGLFIISIPVYAFLVIPFLVVLGGGKARGTVSSIGAIDFGLFLLVYCLGHAGYLTRFSTWLALLLFVSVGVSDMIERGLRSAMPGHSCGSLIAYLLTAPITLLLSLLVAGPAGLPSTHGVVLGLMIPALVIMGNFTLGAIQEDLGIPSQPGPGSGRLFDSVRPYVFSAPVVFHYLRYYTELF